MFGVDVLHRETPIPQVHKSPQPWCLRKLCLPPGQFLLHELALLLPLAHVLGQRPLSIDQAPGASNGFKLVHDL